MISNGCARRLAEQLMDEHMPGLVSEGWTFAWDNAKARCGVCKYGKKTIGLRVAAAA